MMRALKQVTKNLSLVILVAIVAMTALAQNPGKETKNAKFRIWPPDAKISLVTPGAANPTLELGGPADEISFSQANFNQQGKAELIISAADFEDEKIEIDWLKMQDLADKDGFYPAEVTLAGKTFGTKAKAFAHANPWIYFAGLAILLASGTLVTWTQKNKRTALAQAETDRKQQVREERGVAGGERLGPYRLKGQLGSGGMGDVYRAVRIDDPDKENDVALKKLKEVNENSEQAQLDKKRFFREIEILTKLVHPNVVTVLDSGEEDGVLYYTMEILEGRPIGDLIDSETRPDMETVVSILEQAAKGLYAAHSANVIHRDVSHNNIFIKPDGKVKIIDFGLAKDPQAEAKVTMQHAPPGGTIGTVPPEAIFMNSDIGLPKEKNCLTPAYDQFSLATLTYQLLVGESPFKPKYVGQSPQMMSMDFKEIYPVQEFRPELPEALDPVFKKGMAIEFGQRYKTILEFSDAFKKAALG